MKQYIVCSALRNKDGRIICGPRHFDPIMRAQIEANEGRAAWKTSEQGFVDQFGRFLTRQEAYVIAVQNDQIRRRVGGDEGRLFSENLY